MPVATILSSSAAASSCRPISTTHLSPECKLICSEASARPRPAAAILQFHRHRQRGGVFPTPHPSHLTAQPCPWMTVAAVLSSMTTKCRRRPRGQRARRAIAVPAAHRRPGQLPRPTQPMIQSWVPSQSPALESTKSVLAPSPKLPVSRLPLCLASKQCQAAQNYISPAAFRTQSTADQRSLSRLPLRRQRGISKGSRCRE
mmetsp:Transcript_99761/g.320148  ORF Transcript_99761/g.320148 Transcript_99761/m.320148 type:complete len:201 (+) Transcript_99761:218-820(+)